MKFIHLQKSHLVTIGVLLLVVAVTSVLAFFIQDRAEKAARNEANQTLFTDEATASYVDMQGNPTSLEDYRGSIIVVNSWASWSPFSVDELPVLDDIAKNYSDKNVVVLAFNRKETKSQADRFLATLPPLTNLKIIVDTTDFLYGRTGGYAMPETIVYDVDGVVIEHIRGTVHKESLENILNNLITSE